MQCYVRINELPEECQNSFKNVDLGDIVGIEGFIFKSRSGELSLFVRHFQILSKSLEVLPEKFHGIQDVEIKYRHRHLDLISDESSRQVFYTRSKIIRSVRKFLDDRGFIEVDTPVLQPLYGGAEAEPFITHHRALNIDLFMKISPELYLKRLVVGGFEKVYEIGKSFRNEGIDRSHNPEFTMLEFYEAYTDYNYQMQQFEELVSTVCKEIRGTTKILYQERLLDFTPPWKRITIFEGIQQYAQINPEDENALDEFLKLHGDGREFKNIGEKQMKVFEMSVEPQLWQPTFVLDHPKDISPLTKVHRSNPKLVERFEPFAANMEIGNAYSELNDPEEQRQRFEEQKARISKDQVQPYPLDEDFLYAIEMGMPPTGGVGLGIDRLVMILTDRASIRDILLFPTMKVQKK